MEPAVHRITILAPQPPSVWHRLEAVLAAGGSPPIANQCDCAATPSWPVPGSRATIE